jgi:hypothetical protein
MSVADLFISSKAEGCFGIICLSTIFCLWCFYEVSIIYFALMRLQRLLKSCRLCNVVGSLGSLLLMCIIIVTQGGLKIARMLIILSCLLFISRTESCSASPIIFCQLFFVRFEGRSFRSKCFAINKSTRKHKMSFHALTSKSHKSTTTSELMFPHDLNS